MVPIYTQTRPLRVPKRLDLLTARSVVSYTKIAQQFHTCAYHTYLFELCKITRPTRDFAPAVASAPAGDRANENPRLLKPKSSKFESRKRLLTKNPSAFIRRKRLLTEPPGNSPSFYMGRVTHQIVTLPYFFFFNKNLKPSPSGPGFFFFSRHT